MIFSTEQGRDRILAMLAGCRDIADVQACGLLFHGTCETIRGPLHGGSYDGVFWTARTPSVAQAYIPRAGITALVAVPASYRLDDPIRPRDPGDAVTRWALGRARARWEDLDAEMDGPSVRSWKLLPGWPRGRDLVAHVEQDLGYRASRHGCWEVSTVFGPAGQEWKPADWSLPGTLIVAHAPDLEIRNAQWGESDLGDANHNRLDAFARFAELGLEAFRMSDLLQSKHHGNVGHEAIGLLPAGLARLDWIGIPAVRHDGPESDIFGIGDTADFARFMATAAPGYRPHTRFRDAEREPLALGA
ncbi:hypothetical protein LAZ40_09650 [Cereibacter sphaeroides]|uniref:hypothetical protein n=1 Tax=Cereibacter sphaeroides TaxID=1063 RepID=UPI001F478414|nr:hypothetical protein [Cereibacter sphaeroides]MCE6959314.1 hypothetical protein [Cereibacter sphaeroides]MCE6972906.1 hypothetical protein [Cereibacter sphaeroides]